MATTITATEANQRFSEMLRRAERGESFVVTSRGRPVAKLGPPTVEPEDSEAARQERIAKAEALVAHLRTLPRATLPNWRREDLYD